MPILFIGHVQQGPCPGDAELSKDTTLPLRQTKMDNKSFL